jgi:cysteine desulfurase
MKLPIYLDNNATTPVDPRVLEAMLPYFCETFGNAASRNHVFGWKAEEAVEQARQQVASVIGAGAKEIVFTSGATESNNLAIKGVVEMHGRRDGPGPKDHIITQATEHKAVLDPCKHLQQQGWRVTCLPVDSYGLVDLEPLADAITDRTLLVTIMYGNNEIGTLQPVEQIGWLCKERGVLFHTDATQAYGKVPIDVERMGIDLLSLSGHKIYGPKGVGCLYVRRRDPRVRLAIQMHGGGHERNMRSGTLNVPGIVGLGRAAQLCQQEMAEESLRVARLRDKLRDGILGPLEPVRLNGHPTQRLPSNLNLSFAYVEGESLMMAMEDIAVSSGSACTSASLEPSYVLKALGVREDLAHGSIRFSLGRFSTEEEIDYVIGRVVESVRRLREMSPLYEMAKEGVDLKKVQWRAS